jgi:hypothetical protein
MKNLKEKYNQNLQRYNQLIEWEKNAESEELQNPKIQGAATRIVFKCNQIINILIDSGEKVTRNDIINGFEI